jgi:hypothetical protein
MARRGYPQKMREFRWQFATEAACVEYLIPCRWPSYLDESVFRFNRRQSLMAAFQTLRGISLQKKPLTLENLRG